MALLQTMRTSYSFIHDVKSHLTFFYVKKSWQKEDLNSGRRLTYRELYPLDHRRPAAKPPKLLAINPNLSIKANRKQT